MPRELFQEIGELTEEVANALRGKVEKGFAILESSSEKGTFSCRVQPRYSHEESFERVYSEFRDSEYLPLYRRSGDDLKLLVVRRKEAKERGLKPAVHLLLIAATFVTMTWAGLVVWTSGSLGGSVLFAVSLMAILGLHETGHALTARRRGVKATLPFFIPMPPPIFPFGTLGAVIFMNSPIKNRKNLLDVGIAGPLAGFIVSIPILLIGLYYSTGTSREAITGEHFLLGPSLLFYLLARAFFKGYEIVNLHPLAIAGWIGLFVTSLNLLPMGQLDGGHLVRGLMPRHYRKLYFGVAALLLLIGIFIWPGWLVWPLFVWVITRYEHPGPLDDVTELDARRKILAAIGLVMLVLSFAPAPIIPARLMDLVELENLNSK